MRTTAGPVRAGTIALAIVCKTPMAGKSKTRLCPPLTPDQAAALSAAFIRDLSATVAALGGDGVRPVAVYTPAGSEAELRALLPAGFDLLLQREGDLTARLVGAMEDLFAAGHAGVIFLNSDSPTLPAAIVAGAVDALRGGDVVALGPATDGGYTLIGLSRPHRRVFEDIAWSTQTVAATTRVRAAEIGVPVVDLPLWYDVDDAATLAMLREELAGRPPDFATVRGADAPASRAALAAIKV